ncbi:TPA: hypothetical protein DF272_00210 [Candidatus Falkowbacteria bacterium]|nr:hypothetical protein [Candidatus Falkowbacteria bacterium]
MDIVILLRNLGVTPHEKLVEATRRFDFDNMDCADGDPSEDQLETGAFNEFLTKVKKSLPELSAIEKADVYIGWWGDQGTIDIPVEFIALLAQNKWPLTFDIND